MIDDIEFDRIRRDITNESLPADREATRAWINSNPERQRLHAELTRIWMLAPQIARPVDVETARATYMAGVYDSLAMLPQRDRKRDRIQGKPPTPTSRSYRWFALSIAAGVAAFAFFMGRLTSPHMDSPALQSYSNTSDQRSEIALGDGTRVTLGPKTTLNLVRFDDKQRTVSLNGEAYFEVPQATGAPFVVQTSGVNTRVLGTEFLVRHYQSDTSTRVSVASGKVVVSASRSPQSAITLSAGWVGEATDSIAILNDDIARSGNWHNGRIVFDRAPVSTVLKTLSQWYGYEFKVNDSSLIKQHVSATISTRLAQEALATLKLLLDVDISRDGNVITLTPRRAARAPTPSRNPIQRDWINRKNEVS